MSVNILQNGELVPVAGSSSSSEIEKIAEISHNCMYRGKNLTNVYTVEEMYEMVHAGDFSDLYLGDYFTVSITTDLYKRFKGSTFASGTTYYEMGGTVLARTWVATSDSEPTSGKAYYTKSVVTENVDLMYACLGAYPLGAWTANPAFGAILIPRVALTTSLPMNSSNTTEGGYVATDMNNAYLPCYAASFKTALNNHIIPQVVFMTNAVTDGKSSSVTQVQTYLCLTDEVQLTGGAIAGSSYMDNMSNSGKFPVFNYIGFKDTGAAGYFRGSWTRAVANETQFVVSSGEAGIRVANAADSMYHGVRPYMIFG